MDCLQILAGKQFNLKLEAVYESSKAVFIVTELCTGGEMLEYLAEDTMKDGMDTEDVSRISYQLLSAVDHCAKHGIIHRDIKPENIMFSSKDPGAELRLIDFGCATRDEGTKDTDILLPNHKTFMGTPFYLAPELFKADPSYTSRADVFSVGATLLVLVAGYPADNLQKAFNLLQRKKNRNIREFPSLPEEINDTYAEMIEMCLTHDHRVRKSCGQILECEFANFWRAGGGGRTRNILFSGTGARHSAYKNFQNFERSVTTILATVPKREELQSLLKKLEDYKDEDTNGMLKVISVRALKDLLKVEGLLEASVIIDDFAESHTFDNFSYHIELLRSFAKGIDSALGTGPGSNMDSSSRSNASADRARSHQKNMLAKFNNTPRLTSKGHQRTAEESLNITQHAARFLKPASKSFTTKSKDMARNLNVSMHKIVF